ncbi:uncharacterized protein LOC117650547 isoform X1 [Thrips palmi]|uniref:Uncharacterized protein LOC117650547 isoform X1 n=1 Tax=Thrips palmi TaxID=161013 RepID=A0A6P8ZXT7_THRPL|nr:uncharacterized protein LOC117650547 isoform X1 [Thrips palmi]
MARARCRQATARSVARTAVPFFLVLGLAVVAVTAQKKPKPKPLLSLYRSKLVPKMYNLETCADKANSFRIANLSVGLGRFGGEVYDLDLHVLRTAQQISQVKLAVQRCTGAVSPAMCEKFNTWIFTNSICDMMVAKHMAWSPMMQFINPPFKCPMEAASAPGSLGSFSVLSYTSHTYPFIGSNLNNTDTGAGTGTGRLSRLWSWCRNAFLSCFRSLRRRRTEEAPMLMVRPASPSLRSSWRLSPESGCVYPGDGE